MAVSFRARRLVAAAAASGVLVGGASVASMGSAAASSAPASPVRVTHLVGESGGPDWDRCTWRKGHWEKKRANDRWEDKWVPGRWDCRDGGGRR
ncbi:hypothetical protein [Streptomyces sp. I6]|uniref:hypothetical protein n=1 Tax=Streptomyces sp. I6 TaxID=2483113 RepID=UPI00287FFD83|nr:hypothetical protein [Streptomyces sp. I6]